MKNRNFHTKFSSEKIRKIQKKESSQKIKNKMSNKCNYALDVICGLLFAASWWMFADGVASVDVKPGFNAGGFYLYVPGILTTIGFFLMSNLPTSMFQKDNTDEHTWWQKMILVLSVMCKLAGIICAIWCYIDKKADRSTSFLKWRGISTIVQSLLITASSFLWNFLYKDEDSY
ncbi:membrane protein [Tritrichomonas foetus]|uniref:Membrane protein n=1 Tax=Tritrichomonas foetus TaxID=1144522 RepID=A0A1J4J5J6_9EUKA|nr:membrane protein [Tritrichomonas foetus]|eukprot:OHS92907.1 membrane protein [Tritrichomonas foetus]